MIMLHDISYKINKINPILMSLGIRVKIELVLAVFVLL